MRKALVWLDDNLLLIITGFLLAFIPLYPKLPLFEAIPGYIVRVRLEDLLVVFTLIIWLIQIKRKKVSFGPNPLAKPIFTYLAIGILSMISAVFIARTVPLHSLHVGKMVLHFLRRVEYFSLFFVFFSTVKSMRQVKIYLGILLATILGVTLYGYGQKYLYWPAFSTMNREFAKGWALYLTQHARVISTFGGHYDLAAYTMMILILLWALFFSLKNKLFKAMVFVILSGAFWLLILTASRTSFIAYIAGVTMLFATWALLKGIKWAGWRWLAVVGLSMIVMLSFGDLSDRFTQLLKLDQRLGGLKKVLLRPVSEPPSGSIAFLENKQISIEDVTSKSDFPLLPSKPTDVIDDLPEGVVATESATGAAELVQVPRSYSRTALVYDLSTGIRFDALWPQAIAGFMKNPLLGSGYSTLNKVRVSQFTDAESTDNDFLRALGETGILGFLAFGWILAVIIYVIFHSFRRIPDALFTGVMMATVALLMGLLVNAIYIDVFEASKVAFSFWSLVGIVLGGVKVIHAQGKLKERPQSSDLKKMPDKIKTNLDRFIKSNKLHLFIVFVLALGLRLYRIDYPLADWHSWRQADTSAVTRNYVRYGINALFPRYDDLSSVASGLPNPEGYRMVEFPIYNMVAVVIDVLFTGYTVEVSGRLTSIFASLGTLIFLYLLVKKYFGTRIALGAAFFFAVLPYNIFWSRTVLPEPTLVFLTTAMIFFFDKWLTTEKIRFWAMSVLFSMMALLVKFTAIFFAIPMGYLAWRKWRWQIWKKISLYVYSLLTVAPFFAWRWHITHYPEGIPAYTWLLNGNGIRFKGSWFWWLFSERIGKLMLGSWGIVLFGLGLIKNPKKAFNPVSSLLSRFQHLSVAPNWFFHSWLLGMLVYLAVFATGNVQHDYYQIILVPILCVFLALGSEFLIQKGPGVHLWLSRSLLGISVIFMLMFGWYQARDFFNINHPEIVEAGREFDRLVDNYNIRVIAPYNGDTAFLYQTGRRGWPLIEGSIEEMIKKGAHYYISVNFDDQTNDLIQIANNVEQGIDKEHSYKIVKLTNLYVIIQLIPDKLLPPK